MLRNVISLHSVDNVNAFLYVVTKILIHIAYYIHIAPLTGIIGSYPVCGGKMCGLQQCIQLLSYVLTWHHLQPSVDL